MIAIVNNNLPHAGIGKYAFNLFTRLREQQKPVEMIYVEGRGNRLEGQFNGVRKLKQALEVPRYGHIYQNYFYLPRNLPPGYELYHLTCQYHARALKFRSPCVLTHLDTAAYVLPQEYGLVDRIYWRNLMKWYRRAARVIVMSEQAKGELLKWDIVDEDRIRVTNIGYDETIYKPVAKEEARRQLGLPLEAPIVLYVGTETSARKNVITLLQAMVRVRENLPDVLLVKIGRVDPANQSIKSKLNIKELFRLPEAQMPLFYSAADVFAFPSLYEGGYAYPPIEAMACGTPTIVSEDMVLYEKGAVVIPARDSQKLAETIAEILTDREKQEELSRQALEEAKRHTLTKEVEQTYRVYEEVLGQLG